MDTNEIYKLKSAAENKIHQILAELEDETGMAVSEIEYSHQPPVAFEITRSNFFKYTELNIKLSTI